MYYLTVLEAKSSIKMRVQLVLSEGFEGKITLSLPASFWWLTTILVPKLEYA